jgi:hypothetical protein
VGQQTNRKVQTIEKGRGHYLHGCHRHAAADTLQRPRSIQLDPVTQGLFNHSQAARCGRQSLARRQKPNHFLVELKRVPAPLRIPHLRFRFAI